MIWQIQQTLRYIFQFIFDFKPPIHQKNDMFWLMLNRIESTRKVKKEYVFEYLPAFQ